MGSRIAAVSAQWEVEYAKNALQNITTKWTPHSVHILYHCTIVWYHGVCCTISHHHGEDGKELLLRDAIVAVEVVHAEGDWNRIKPINLGVVYQH